MGRIVAQEFVSLDGVMEAPDKWQLPNGLFDEVGMGAYVGDAFTNAEELLLGRRTYQEFAGFWPKQPDSDPFAKLLNGLPKYVVTKTLRELEWNNSKRVDGDLVAEVARLKQHHAGDVLIIGSAQLVSGLTAKRLIDEYQLIVHPIVVGRGKQLFAQGIDPTLFDLVDTKSFSTGVVALRVKPKGPAQVTL